MGTSELKTDLAATIALAALLFAASFTCAQTVTTTAGGFVGDGRPATKASLTDPYFAAQDSNGNIYVSDASGQRIRKINSAGKIGTYAGTGIAGYSGDGGPATAATLHNPAGITFDSAGNLIIADSFNHRIRKVNKSGKITTIAGTGALGYSGDGGPATQATFNYPSYVAYDGAGNLYISDLQNNVVRVVNRSGIITTYAGNGTRGYSGDGGPATQAELYHPFALAAGGGNLFIADEFNNRIRMVNATGTITTFAGNGSFSDSGDGGPATSAGVYEPQGLALDHGTVYISTPSRIRRVKISSGIIDAYAGIIGSGYDGDGHPLLSSEFALPTGLFSNSEGNLVVVDSFNTRLREATGGVMQTIAGGYIGDGGPAVSGALVDPAKAAFDKAGNYYIVDSSGNRIRKVSKTGKITTVAGTGISGYSGDGGPATSATLWAPYGITVDSSGNIFIADTSNAVVRKVDTSGNISTFASNSSFVGLGAMATDASDNLYVVDFGGCVVWKISPAGAASIVAGVWFSCGYNGDNISATTAELNLPFGLTVDSRGNIFIADTFNRRIRKVNSRGVITTVAGNGACGFSGDGGSATAAQLCDPWEVAVDAVGTLYIADTSNVRIRKVSKGTITTYAGTGARGYNGDGLPALSTNFDFLVGVTVDPHGTVFVVDDSQKLVRKIH